MNAPYLESSEQLNCFFPDSLQKIKFHIFQNITEFLIHVLRPFKFKNAYEMCDNIFDKDKRGRIIVKKSFVIQEEILDVFRETFYIPTI